MYRDAADEVPGTDELRREMMRNLVTEFDERLQKAVHDVPAGSRIMEVRLQDWPAKQWPKTVRNITLAGDAAHAMTMYRGEAANHGILDAFELMQSLENVDGGGTSLQLALDKYEASMRERTAAAVLLSRQACLDAHDFHGLNEHSAVLKRRAIAGV